MILPIVKQINSLPKVEIRRIWAAKQRTLFFTKKEPKAKPAVVCPPTHEEIPPPPSKFLQNLAVFSIGAFLGNIMDNYARPFFREKFPEPPCDPKELEDEVEEEQCLEN